MFWKKRKYNLPKFPPNVIPQFNKLCEDLNDNEFAELSLLVKKNFEAEFAIGRDEDNFTVDEAREVEKVCLFLIDEYHKFPTDKKRLVVGALRYCAISDDAFDDRAFASGMTDDQQVLNYVLEELGVEDKFIKIL